MRKIFLLFIIVLSFSFSFNVFAEEEVKEYTFDEFLQICKDVESKVQSIKDTMTWEEKHGCELGSKELSALEQEIFYNEVMDDIYNQVISDFELQREEIVRLSGYVAQNIFLDDSIDYIAYQAEMDGRTRICLTDLYINGSRDIVNEIMIRSNNDLSFIDEGKYITIEGKFLRNGPINDMDYLFDCKLIEMKEHENPYYNDLMIYSCAYEILRNNFDFEWKICDLTDWKRLYINKNDYMAEVSGYAKHSDGSLKKWIVEFTYSITKEGKYSYQSIYMYVDGYTPYGNYILIE